VSGHFLLVGLRDGRSLVWDVSAGELSTELDDGFPQVAWIQGDNVIIRRGAQLDIESVALSDLIKVAEGLTRPFSPDERRAYLPDEEYASDVNRETRKTSPHDPERIDR
jgi:hypothetical protein